jgi:protein-S-isoprenylcysteine O-methyltransferase Ste14
MTPLHSHILLALLWAAWCFLHSFLISRHFTAFLKRILGRRYGYSRLAYTFFSLVSLVPVFAYQLGLAETVIFAWPWPWSLLKYAMYGAASLFFYGGLRVYDVQYMLGLQQVRQLHRGVEPAGVPFSREGILGRVRHPWYSGAILFVLAYGDVTDASLVVKTVLSVYVVIGALLEERKLMGEYGEPYRAYRREVPMFIPWKKR